MKTPMEQQVPAVSWPATMHAREESTSRLPVTSLRCWKTVAKQFQVKVDLLKISVWLWAPSVSSLWWSHEIFCAFKGFVNIFNFVKIQVRGLNALNDGLKAHIFCWELKQNQNLHLFNSKCVFKRAWHLNQLSVSEDWNPNISCSVQWFHCEHWNIIWLHLGFPCPANVASACSEFFQITTTTSWSQK